MEIGDKGLPILGPVLISIFINYIGSGTKCTLNQFADTIKMSNVVDTPEGQHTIQRDANKLKRWAHVNLMRFKKAKSKVLHLDQVPTISTIYISIVDIYIIYTQLMYIVDIYS